MKYKIDKLKGDGLTIQACSHAARTLMEAFTHNMEIPRDNGGEPMFSKKDLERIGDAYVAYAMRLVEITEACATPVEVEKDFKVEVSLTKSYKFKCKSKQEAEWKADIQFLEDIPFRKMKTEEV